MKVLYVDGDLETAGGAIQGINKEYGQELEIELAGTVREAVRKLLASPNPPYDVLLAPLLLPDGKAFDLFDLIRREGRPIAAVVIVEAGGEAAAADALRAGFEDFIPRNSDFCRWLPLTLETALFRFRTRAALVARLTRHQKLEAVGTLASGLAHEINNSINSIMNYTELILDALSPGSAQRTYAEEIIREGNRVAESVRNLVQFSRKDRQAGSLARMVDIAHSTLALYQSALRKDQIAVEVHIPEDLPEIRCQTQQMKQVFLNLLNNAREALNLRYAAFHENKMLAIRAATFSREGRTWIRITFEDHGAGIPPDILPRIFEPFFTTKPGNLGSGLGLTIVKDIINDQGGEIHVESKPDCWTRFHLDLPIYPESH